jgi:hypothetical protein
MIKVKIAGRMRALTDEQAAKFFNPRKPTKNEIAFVDAYLRLNRDPCRAYKIAYPHSARWQGSKRNKAGRELLKRGSVDKLISERETAFLKQILSNETTP